MLAHSRLKIILVHARIKKPTAVISGPNFIDTPLAFIRTLGLEPPGSITVICSAVMLTLLSVCIFNVYVVG